MIIIIKEGNSYYQKYLPGGNLVSDQSKATKFISLEAAKKEAIYQKLERPSFYKIEYLETEVK